eukprot:SAG11_NODE_34571_length_271_cov_0.604651_1_plen_76_part_01
MFYTLEGVSYADSPGSGARRLPSPSHRKHLEVLFQSPFRLVAYSGTSPRCLRSTQPSAAPCTCLPTTFTPVLRDLR